MNSNSFSQTIIYTDNHLLVVDKPAGVLIQGDKTGDPSLLEAGKQHLKEVFHKPGNVYLGLVHRLDRPVSGVVIFARTSKAASRLSEQIRRRSIKKRYYALVKGEIPSKGTLEHRIERDGATSRVHPSDHSRGKLAKLRYQRLKFDKGISLIEVDLETGRHHQIRAQLSAIGFPILGDFRYGSKVKFPYKTLALHAVSISIQHPTTGKELTFGAPPPDEWPSNMRKVW